MLEVGKEGWDSHSRVVMEAILRRIRDVHLLLDNLLKFEEKTT